MMVEMDRVAEWLSNDEWINMIKKYLHYITSYNNEIFPSAKFAGTNCFIVGSEKERFLVDTGSFPEKDPTFVPRLREFMQKQ